MSNTQQAKNLLKSAAANLLHYSGILRLIPSANQQSWRILMYHRVIDPVEAGYPLQPGMYVTPESFAMQMHYLSKEARVIGINQLVEELQSGKEIPAKTVVLTFDDGWADNYTHAFPILKELRLPASIYLATSFIGTNRSYWSDSIAQALYLLSREPKHLQTVCARLEESEIIDERAAACCVQFLRMTEPSESPEAFDSLVERIAALPYDERMQTVNTILKLSKEFCVTPSQRSFLAWDEVAEMANAGITFGSHTHHHHPLVELSETRIKDEIEHSMLELRDHNIEATSVFCYPRGSFDDKTQQALHDKNIPYALTTTRESDFDAHPILLGRIGIHNDISHTLPLFCSRVWLTNVF